MVSTSSQGTACPARRAPSAYVTARITASMHASYKRARELRVQANDVSVSLQRSLNPQVDKREAAQRQILVKH